MDTSNQIDIVPAVRTWIPALNNPAVRVIPADIVCSSCEDMDTSNKRHDPAVRAKPADIRVPAVRTCIPA